MFAAQLNGEEVETVEALAPADSTTEEDLSPVQAAMWRRHGLQCGFCTPGMVLTITALMRTGIPCSPEDVKDYLSGNICRCTGYVPIVAAIQRAAAVMAEESKK